MKRMSTRDRLLRCRPIIAAQVDIFLFQRNSWKHSFYPLFVLVVVVNAIWRSAWNVLRDTVRISPAPHRILGTNHALPVFVHPFSFSSQVWGGVSLVRFSAKQMVSLWSEPWHTRTISSISNQ